MLGDRLSTERESVDSKLSNRILRALFIAFLVLSAGCVGLKRCAYEGFNREAWQKPEKVIRTLSVSAGDHVADLGSGSGYFTFRLAHAAGPSGKVYASDTDRDMNEDLATRAGEAGYQNIEVIVAEPHDPLLPETGVDLVFTCNVYHHLRDRVAYFANAAKYLRPNGRVAIIDFNGEGWLEKLVGHWTASEVIKQEMKEAGYSLEGEFQFLPKQVFLVFSRHGAIGE